MIGQIESLNGFFLIYTKDKKVAAILGLPSVSAAGLGISDANIPTSGTLLLNFTGEAVSSLASNTNPTPAASLATAVSTKTAINSSPTAANTTIPSYTGATNITLPDTVKVQFSSAVGSNVANPQVAAFVTKDNRATVKTFYADYFTKNGWKDETSSLSSDGVNQMESTGGFFLLYTKDRTAVVMMGFPSNIAPALGVPSADIPASGMVVMGFSGQGK